jgi:hypothetical protein
MQYSIFHTIGSSDLLCPSPAPNFKTLFRDPVGMETAHIPGNYWVLAFLVSVIYHRRRKGFFRSSDMADVD